jgi:hypothetical protein
LGARIVSYLNLDTAVDGDSSFWFMEMITPVCFLQIGNYTVNVRASPILFDAIVEAAKMVTITL